MVLELLVLFFVWVIGLYVGIAANVKHRKKGRYDCESEITGVLDIWRNVDEYLSLCYSHYCVLDVGNQFCQAGLTTYYAYTKSNGIIII